jgi:hypothetical protein
MATIDERMAWSGQCNECLALVVLWASDETDPVEQELTSSQWPESRTCYVQDCEGDVEWNGNDPLDVVIIAGRR